MLTVDREGVHIRHCCLVHGCKYGFMTKDPCPVKMGLKKQEFRCEYCEEDWESWGKPTCSIQTCKDPGYWRWSSEVACQTISGEVFTFDALLVFCNNHDSSQRTSSIFGPKLIAREDRVL